MKKTIALLLALILCAAAFASCAAEKKPGQPASDAAQSPSSTGEERSTPSSGEPTSPDQPTEPTEPTETPNPFAERDKDLDGVPATEEDLGVLPVGQYTIKPKNGDRGLSYAYAEKNNEANIPATLGGELNSFLIVYQTHKKDPYYLVCAGGDAMHVLSSADRYSIDDGEEMVFRGKQYTSGSTTYWDDKFETMQWQFIKNADGSYKIMNNTANADLYLAVKNGRVIVENTSRENAADFEVTMTERGPGKTFLQYISDGGDVVVRLDTNIKSRTKLTDAELQLWANNLEQAYRHYCDLTSYVTYESIVVKAFEPSPHIGYVWNSSEHYNVITIEHTFMRTDLTKMKERAKLGAIDWNFCALHEMGHMFDNQMPWYFEAEMMTDSKIPYVLQAGGGCAAPSEYGFKDYFYADKLEGHRQIEECYRGLAAGQTGIAESFTYGAYGAALKFTEIQRQIDDDNWTAFKKTFASLKAEGLTTWRNSERFVNFIDRLSQLSGKDVRALFTDSEWNVWHVQYYNYAAISFTVQENGKTVTKPTASGSVRIGSTLPVGADSTSTLSYRSENESVASVSEDGTVTGVAKGKTRIVVTAPGFETYFTVTVS